jgi:Dyp-type peroxidase family
VILELHDIQGLLMRGYGDHLEARFLLLEVANDEAARAYLRALCGRINLARDTPGNVALQVAFTARGLARLGVPDDALETFSREFREGMDDDDRSDVLGDRGDNDPSTWHWGRREEPVHVLLIVYALDATIMTRQLAEERAALAGGFRVLHDKPSTSRTDHKEHFGWSDGLSMPKIAGVPPERPKKKKQPSWTHALPAGEFLLGYRNDYDAYTPSPTVDPADDVGNHLLPDGDRRSLGRNGTYLVYREMTQDVHGFWSYLVEHSRESTGDAVTRATALGTKMVGRWPNGAPLITSEHADLEAHAHDNEFLYGKDLAGLVCPHGSHIRRANPRDVLAVEDRGSEASLQMVRKHQMVRRGRPYGPFISEDLKPSELAAAKPDGVPRGLHFLCLVGDIARQFEFVQRAWIDSAVFDSLYKDGDPISAVRRRGDNANDEFTCPADPVRRKYKQLPTFTRLVGGGYFFLPGLAALRFIARHP